MKLYGDAYTNMICQPGKPGCTTFGKEGLWQDAKQLSATMVHIASDPHPVTTYVELGVWTAWTCALMSAYLQRVGSAADHFQGAAVDVTSIHISQATRRLLHANNASIVSRHSFDSWMLKVRSQRYGRPVDLCFIDANHSYDAVRSDYESYAKDCRSIMLHDIQDTTTLELHKNHRGGGVPSLWHQLVASVKATRVTSFTQQHSTFAPVFGIGLVGPNERGTAEADDWLAWESWGRGIDAWHSLTRARRSPRDAGGVVR